MSRLDLIEQLSDSFEQHRNPDNALPMQKYMKDHFPFLGIKSPQRKELFRKFYRESGLQKEPFQPEFVLALWEKDEREYQYAAMDYIERSLKKLTKNDLLLMEKLITTKSWWDTVDMLQKPVGTIAAKWPGNPKQ